MKNYKPIEKIPEGFETYVNSVNAYDLWHQEDKNFEYGKVLNRACVDSKEINLNLFPVDNFNYRSSVLKEAIKYLSDGCHIEYDDNILKYKKKFLRRDKENNTIDNLVADYMLELLNSNKENMTIYYDQYKGILTNAIGNSSVLGNAFLTANSDYDFFLDVGNTGNISLRADGNIDVSKIAAKFFGGGGHPNASGGRAQGLRDIFIYPTLKSQIEDRLQS
ncbi:MAG: DHHA1 domain-containing protein [Campylobacterales bacterium]|nr:DHHA1 domain-containing protein [Campylobacterales bacterium]